MDCSSSKSKKNITSDVCLLAKPGATCSLCKECDDNELLFGKFFKLRRLNLHHFCLLLSAKLLQNGHDSEGILGFLFEDISREIKRVSKVKCYYCGWCGATISCHHPSCNRIFHLPCGRRNGALNMFSDQFQSYCSDHRPMQSVDVSVFKDRDDSHLDTLVVPLVRVDDPNKHNPCRKLATPTSGESDSEPFYTCAICYDAIVPYPTARSIWPECCRKDCWLHRICLEKFALSAGKYHVRCPLCNNQKVFLEMLYRLGFYVPDQDASWELEDGAFRDLLERPTACFREDCLCPKGNRYTTSKNGPWKLVTCGLCGSQAVHRDCDPNKGRKNIVCNRCLPSPNRGPPDNMDPATVEELDDDSISESDESPEDHSHPVDNDSVNEDVAVVALQEASTQSDSVSPQANSHAAEDAKVQFVSYANRTETRQLISRLSTTLKVVKQLNTTEIDLSQDTEEGGEETTSGSGLSCEDKGRSVRRRKSHKKPKRLRQKKKVVVKAKSGRVMYSKRDIVTGRFLKKSFMGITVTKSMSGAEDGDKASSQSTVTAVESTRTQPTCLHQKPHPHRKAKAASKSQSRFKEIHSNKRKVEKAGNESDPGRVESADTKCWTGTRADSCSSWSTGKPRDGINVVLKHGKFCVLFHGQHLEASSTPEVSNEGGNQESKPVVVKQEKGGPGFSSVSSKKRNGKKLVHEKGQKDITLFFKKSLETKSEESFGPLHHDDIKKEPGSGNEDNPVKGSQRSRKSKKYRKRQKKCLLNQKVQANIENCFNRESSLKQDVSTINHKSSLDYGLSITRGVEATRASRKMVKTYTRKALSASNECSYQTGNYFKNTQKQGAAVASSDEDLDDGKDSGIAENSDHNNSFESAVVEVKHTRKRKTKRSHPSDGLAKVADTCEAASQTKKPRYSEKVCDI